MTKKYDGYSKEAVEWLNEADSASFEATVPLYDKVIKSFPDPPYAYARRGLAKYKNGDYLGAIADFDEAVYRKPKASDTIWQRAIAKWEIDDYSGAVNDFKKYNDIKPDDDEASYWMGAIYESNEEYELALECYKRACEIDKSYKDAKKLVEYLQRKLK